MVSLCSPVCSRTSSTDQAGFKLKETGLKLTEIVTFLKKQNCRNGNNVKVQKG